MLSHLSVRYRVRSLGVPFLVAALVAVFAQAAAAQQRRPLALDDLGDLVNLSDPQLSPDGRTVALIVSRPDYEENRFAGELVLVEVTTGEHRALTHDRPYVSSPRWSPTGDRIAFLARADGSSQIFVLPMGSGESRQVTEVEGGVMGFEWSPSGDELALLIEDRPEEREDVERHNKSFVVGDDHYLSQAATLPRHLWIVSVAGGEPERLTSGRAGLANDLGVPFAWTPRGDLAYAGQPDPGTGLFDRHTIHVVSRGGAVRTLMGEPEGYGVPFVSPDGERVAFSRPLEGGPFFNPHGIYVMPTSGGDGRVVTTRLDHTFYGGEWTPDGNGIIVSAPSGNRTSMWVQPLDGEPVEIDMGDVHPVGFDVGSDGAIAVLGTTRDRPVELYHLAGTQDAPRRLTAFNEAVASLSLGAVETVTWRTGGGFEANGILTYPPDFDSDRDYPLVLSIHGGPMGSSLEGFSVLPQLLAAKGWVVFSPNYRGSGNLGGAYQRAVIGDAGEGPGRDVMAGIEVVKDRGFVDESRIGVSGWSYGGYMTTWLTGHYDIWTAAVAGAAVTDYRDQYSLSDMNASFAPAFPENPWTEDGAEMWEEQSPITYARDMSTPTLILSNTGDLRVPIVESYKLYHALKDNGVEVEFVAYPIPGHFAQDPIHVRDVYRRWIEWFETHFARVPSAE